MLTTMIFLALWPLLPLFLYRVTGQSRRDYASHLKRWNEENAARLTRRRALWFAVFGPFGAMGVLVDAGLDGLGALRSRASLPSLTQWLVPEHVAWEREQAWRQHEREVEALDQATWGTLSSPTSLTAWQEEIKKTVSALASPAVDQDAIVKEVRPAMTETRRDSLYRPIRRAPRRGTLDASETQEVEQR